MTEAPGRVAEQRRGAPLPPPASPSRRDDGTQDQAVPGQSGSALSVLAQIAQLQHMTMRELRQRWMKLHGTAAPTYARTFLVSRLAYRIQELAYGGLTPTAKRRLDAIADRLDQARQDQGRRKRRVEHARPVPGTRLIREWQGVQHCVTVLADGYDYQGRPYRSLSAVSKAIVGYAWNGPAFFGLRAQNRAGKP